MHNVHLGENFQTTKHIFEVQRVPFLGERIWNADIPEHIGKKQQDILDNSHVENGAKNWSLVEYSNPVPDETVETSEGCVVHFI